MKRCMYATFEPCTERNNYKMYATLEPCTQKIISQTDEYLVSSALYTYVLKK